MSSWLHSEWTILIDIRSGEFQRRDRPASPTVAYQDCDRFDERHILCAGGQTPEGSWYPHRNGVLHLLKTDGNSFKTLKVTLTKGLAWAPQLEGTLSDKFGSRRFVSIETLGDIEIDEENLYGDYATPRPLTNGGMALGPNKEYIYFLPDDLPRAKLIRFKLGGTPTSASR